MDIPETRYAKTDDGLSIAYQVFGTGARLVVTNPACLTTAREAVDLELAAIDVAASLFRSDSEICAVNSAISSNANAARCNSRSPSW